MSLSEDDNKLVFKCINTIDTIDLKVEHIEKGKSGIGLQNAKKRLALMYPEKHQLTMTKTDTSYSIELILDL